jgi:hypothetical protein
MNFISSREILDFLSKSAPRAWVKRMLLWMIFRGELEPFFEEGRSVESAPAYLLIWDVADPAINGEERDRLIRENYDATLAERLINAGHSDRIERLVHEWENEDGLREVAAAYFVFATSIDWEAGVLDAEIEHQSIRENDLLFWDEDDLLQGEFKKADYAIRLGGLCFEAEKIEMLQPHVTLVPARSNLPPAATAIGRPRTWDWDGATTFLLTIAQTPDGLPTGPGAQAQIERLLADWFLKNAGKEPAESLVRKHATKIMRALNKPESQ